MTLNWKACEKKKKFPDSDLGSYDLHPAIIICAGWLYLCAPTVELKLADEGFKWP